MAGEGLELRSSEFKPMLSRLYHTEPSFFSEFFTSGTAYNRNLGS